MPKALNKSVGRISNLKSVMKKSNVSYENLLEQLSEERINRVVDFSALRAGGLEILCPPAENTHSGSSCGSKSGSHSGSSANNGAPFGICI